VKAIVLHTTVQGRKRTNDLYATLGGAYHGSHTPSFERAGPTAPPSHNERRFQSLGFRTALNHRRKTTP